MPNTLMKELMDRSAADSLERKTSRIPGAGLGVFATRLIPKGTPVCYYAGYDKPAEKVAKHEAAYAINSTISSHHALVGFMYVRQDQPAGVAQLLNDPFAPNIINGYPHRASRVKRLRFLGKAFAEYIRKSPAQQNLDCSDICDNV